MQTHTHTQKLTPSNTGSTDTKAIMHSNNQQFQAYQANATHKLIPISNKPRERLISILMVLDQSREKILTM